MNQKQKPSVLGGAMIAAGTMIGAGMLSLPIVSAGMWFSWTMIIMMLSAGFMHISAEQILEVNLNYKPGASFDTLVADNLGTFWNIINGLSIAFVLYILLYAYVVGSGSVLSDTLESQLHFTFPKPLTALIFSLILSATVWWSTKTVDRISTILMIGMFLTLAVALLGLLNTIEPTRLFRPNGENRFALYAFASLPFFLTSFCFHASVPSFVKYYGIEGKRIRNAILIGMIITFIFYGFWMLAIMGNIDRIDFLSVGKDEIAWLLNKVNASHFFDYALRLFSFFAVVTSFLGAGLGLFDYIADLFNINDSFQGRLKTALITFLPPTLLGMVFPNGFILAIGFAGFFAAIWSVIVPGMMVLAFRKKMAHSKNPIIFRAVGGRIMPYLVILYGLISALSYLLVEIFKLDVLNYLA